MRYWLFSLGLAMMLVTVGNTQETKKKSKDDKDPKEHVTPTVTEIAGKGFNEWAKEIHSSDPSEREIAIKTILNFGPEKAYKVVPEILKELEKHNKTTVDLSVRVNGTLALSTIFQYKKDPDPKYLKEAVAIFRVSIKDKQAIMKIRTLQALPYLGPVAREALPEVVDAVNDPISWEARQVAIQTLATLAGYDLKGPPPFKAMPALYAALDDSSSIVRYAALQAIPTVGYNMKEPEKFPFYTKINNLAASGKSTVRIQAHLTMIVFKHGVNPKGLVDPIAKKEHLDPICKMIKNPDPTTRLNALQAVGSLGTSAQAAIPFVIEGLHDQDVDIAANAMVTLIHLRAYSAMSDLRNLKEDAKVNPALKQAAEDTLDQLQYAKDLELKQKTEKKIDKK